MHLARTLILVGLSTLSGCQNSVPTTRLEQAPEATQTPHLALYQPAQQTPQLLHQVQMQHLFDDGKTFVDMKPRLPPAQIAELYRERELTRTELLDFVDEHFQPLTPAPTAVTDTAVPVDMWAHIDGLWSQLTRGPDRSASRSPLSSLIPLPYPYVVPGGRFREIYYWDSYFTLQGLVTSGHPDLAVNMVRNFAWLIDQFGFVPNGNRSYYLSRSQPPFFAAMVRLLRQQGLIDAGEFLPQLEKEHRFWMAGATDLPPTGGASALRRVVRLEDGSLLNRYFDNLAEPRPESYREDVHTGAASKRAKPEVYRNLRAAAESGWDFSSRWLDPGNALASIDTTNIIPVDLNSLLYLLESELSAQYRLTNDAESARAFALSAEARRQAVRQWLWDEDLQRFGDRYIEQDRMTPIASLAMVYPLYFELANARQAQATATLLTEQFLMPGGLVTTLADTGQQWDYPNGWAPLQWLAVVGLQHYGYESLATSVATRWLDLNAKVFADTGRMMEKYNVVDLSLVAGGGEYPTQDGFGWTNGVAVALKHRIGEVQQHSADQPVDIYQSVTVSISAPSFVTNE